MKILTVLTLVLLMTPTRAHAWGGCVVQIPPLCLYPAVPLCVSGGVTKPDFWICYNPGY